MLCCYAHGRRQRLDLLVTSCSNSGITPSAITHDAFNIFSLLCEQHFGCAVQVGKAAVAVRGRKRKIGEQASSKDLQLAGILHIMFLLANDEVGPAAPHLHALGLS